MKSKLEGTVFFLRISIGLNFNLVLIKNNRHSEGPAKLVFSNFHWFWGWKFTTITYINYSCNTTDIIEHPMEWLTSPFVILNILCACECFLVFSPFPLSTENELRTFTSSLPKYQYLCFLFVSLLSYIFFYFRCGL